MHAFDVLGDPVRRRILELLATGELTAGAIGETIQRDHRISQPAVSQHLRVLRESGFVSVRPDRTRRLYAVRAEGLRDVESWLERFRHFWTPPLAARAPRSPGGSALLEAGEARVAGRRNDRSGRSTVEVHGDVGVRRHLYGSGQDVAR